MINKLIGWVIIHPHSNRPHNTKIYITPGIANREVKKYGGVVKEAFITLE